MTTSAASLLRPAAALALAAALGLLTGASDARANATGPGANLTDVRVGVHPSHTRIVIETDAAAPYVVDPSGEELLIHVDAASTAEAVTAKSPHLIWVKVEPSAIGTDVRVQLKQPVDVKPLVLTRPDRIVLDLYPRAAVAEPIPAPVLLPEEEAPPVFAEAEPEPMAEPELELPPEDEPGLPVEEAEEPLVLELPEVEVPELAEAARDAEEMEEALAPAPADAEREVIRGRVLEPEAPTEEARAPSGPTTPAAPAPSGSRFGSPFALAATALVLLVLFVWLRRRLRAAEPSPIPPLPDEEAEPAPFAMPASAAAAEAEAADSVFDVEPDALDEAEALPTLRTPAMADLEPADESERRMAHLEKKLEELAEAKDRLERQIAAQTEELRVQRAAIARTQRVLRSIAPKDDESSEPLVRG